jgi:hypothetical protein
MPDQSSSGDLELRLVPHGVEDGIPQSFTILLVNHTDHDVFLPMPITDCQGSYTGVTGLVVHFTPLLPEAPQPGRGCSASRYTWPPIMERIKEWQVVHPGEEFNLLGGSKAAYFESQMPGTYEVWAGYLPPFISPQDQAILEAAGIDFPREALTTPHLTFSRNVPRGPMQ